MNKMAGLFMKAGVLYALVGFSMGLYMAAGHDFTLRSVHSHLVLVGWATMAICAAYYQLVPQAAGAAIAKVHFVAANIGLVVMAVGVALLASGMAAAEAGAAIGSIITLLSMLLFVYIVFRSA